MIYELRCFDTPLMRFKATSDTSIPEVEIVWVNDEKKYLLPLDIKCNGDSVSNWLRHRIIPKNRAYVTNFLKQMRNEHKPTNECYQCFERTFIE